MASLEVYDFSGGSNCTFSGNCKRTRLRMVSEHTNLLIKFAVLYMCSSWYPKTITVVTSNITDHRS